VTLNKYQMNRPLLFCMLFVVACKTPQTFMNTSATEQALFDSLLQSNTNLKSFLDQKDSLRIQILYTKIERNKNNHPSFTEYAFNVNPEAYFYPASTVKMPVAFLALEKLNELRKKRIDRNTLMVTDSSFGGQAPFYKFDNKGTISNYVEQIFAVSDNEAFNRLYEFVGQKSIQQKLLEKGYDDVVIRHRLSVGLSDNQNAQTQQIRFYDAGNNLLYTQPEQQSNATYKEPDIKIGKGYMGGGKLINRPFPFANKNRVALRDLNTMLRTVLFPETVAKQQRFNISEDDRQYLLRSMSSYPREALQNKYVEKDQTDVYVKFLLDGLVDMPSYPNIRCFNKSGLAYGFLTDISYFVDFENKVEFMISATILSNKNEIFNDDTYDFDTIGFPFMKALGKSIYEYELKRERKYKPDLSAFKFQY
jgi:hypothetical protein